jgi:YVTN family beta-propeller protein
MALATTVRQARRAAILAAVVLAAAGCGVHPHQQVLDPPAATANRRPTGGSASPDVYAADRPGRLSPVVRGFPSRVYVPNSNDGTVDVIDPATRRVVDHFATGRLPSMSSPPGICGRCGSPTTRATA